MNRRDVELHGHPGGRRYHRTGQAIFIRRMGELVALRGGRKADYLPHASMRIGALDEAVEELKRFDRGPPKFGSGMHPSNRLRTRMAQAFTG